MRIEERYDRVRLRKIAEQAIGREVLDIGYARKPNPFLQGFHTIGFDLNEVECNYAEKIRGDVLEISKSLVGRTFDTIIAGEFIEHVEDPYMFLRSLLPYFSKDARLVLSTPNPVAFPTLLFEWARSHRFFYTTEHKHYFPPRWVERILDQSGYDVRAVKSVGLWPTAIPSFVPASFSYQVVYVATPRT